MLVNFEEIPPLGLSFSWEIAALDAGADCRPESPIAARCRVRLAGPGKAEVEGRLTGAVSLACDRCLTRFSFPVDVSFQVRAQVMEAGSEDGSGTRPVEEPADLDLIELDGPCLNLDELMREQILLSLPEKRLCRPDCAGLCPECGANRNEAPCACGGSAAHPAFAALAAWAGKKGG